MCVGRGGSLGVGFEVEPVLLVGEGDGHEEGTETKEAGDAVALAEAGDVPEEDFEDGEDEEEEGLPADEGGTTPEAGSEEGGSVEHEEGGDSEGALNACGCVSFRGDDAGSGPEGVDLPDAGDDGEEVEGDEGGGGEGPEGVGLGGVGAGEAVLGPTGGGEDGEGDNGVEEVGAAEGGVRVGVLEGGEFAG